MFSKYSFGALRLKRSRSSQAHVYAKVVSSQQKGIFILKKPSRLGVGRGVLALQRARKG